VFDDWETYGGVYAATIATAFSTLGLLTVAFVGDWGKRNSPQFSAFAVGFLAVAIICHLIPEAIESSVSPGNKALDAMLWFGGGFGVIGLIAAIVRAFTSRRAEGKDLALGFASIVALGAHSLIDGLFYQSAFKLGPDTGWISVSALIIHEIPEAVIAYFLVRDTGATKVSAASWAFVAASLTTFVGAWGALWLIGDPDWLQPGALMALTAGALSYVAGLHLAPHARLAREGQGYYWLSWGIAWSLFVVVLTMIADSAR